MRTTGGGAGLHAGVLINGKSVGKTLLRWSDIELGEICRVEVRLKGWHAPPQAFRVEKRGRIPLSFVMKESVLPPGFDQAFVVPMGGHCPSPHLHAATT